MTAVSVLVPWRGGDDHRERAWAWLADRWAAEYPDWQVAVGTCSTDEWRKALAVDDALQRADGEMLVLADADVWIDPGALDRAVAELDDHPWVVPHHHVKRLSPHGTDTVLAGATWIEAGLEHRGCYVGHEGGGMVVLRRETYETCPLDPRFAGWGQEDDAWALALRTLVGRPWRGRADLWHLWHEPQPRLERKVGSMDGQRLWLRYRGLAEAGDHATMRALVAEGVSAGADL